VQTSHEPLLKQLFLDRIIMPQMFKANTVLADYARSYTLQRVNQYRSGERSVDVKDGYQDILTHLLDARDEETNSVYSENELLGEAILLLMAGACFPHFYQFIGKDYKSCMN
jgi:cytochrome P450